MGLGARLVRETAQGRGEGANGPSWRVSGRFSREVPQATPLDSIQPLPKTLYQNGDFVFFTDDN